jgi:hypothetical protein
MRRLLLVLGLVLLSAGSARAQNCVTINGASVCTASTATAPTMAVRQRGAGYAFCVQSAITGANLWCIDKTGVSSSTVASIFGADAIAATSTDGLIIRNSTAASAGVTVQMSPRLRLQGAGWNSTSGLSETDSFFLENLPATVAGTTTARLKFGYIGNGGAATYPLQMTNGGGLLFIDNTVDIGAQGANRPSNIWAAAQINGLTVGIQSVAGAGFTWGNGNRIISGATPTISSGFGTSPSITGAASVFRVTLGNPVAQAGVVLFNASPAFGSAPFVSCRDEITQAANPPTYAVTTTQVTITFTAAVAGDTVVCSVQGLP